MPYLLQATICVGAIGAALATPLLCLLRIQHSYLSEPVFVWSAPVVVFFTAAFAFGTTYELLPSSRWRARVAGLIAGIVSFFSIAFWASLVANMGQSPLDRLPGMLVSFAIAFTLVGWIPLGGGWFAGWIASKLAGAPAEEAA